MNDFDVMTKCFTMVEENFEFRSSEMLQNERFQLGLSKDLSKNLLMDIYNTQTNWAKGYNKQNAENVGVTPGDR